jgi:hypothetical protein
VFAVSGVQILGFNFDLLGMNGEEEKDRVLWLIK